MKTRKYPILNKEKRYEDVETRARHAFLRYAEKAYYCAEEDLKRALKYKRASDKAFAIWMRALSTDEQ